MTLYRIILSIAVYAVGCISALAADFVILDMTERNKNSEDEGSGDFSRQLYSATYLCDIAGYGYTVTQSIDEATAQPGVILLSSNIISSSFTPGELKMLAKWVADGGVLVSPAIRAADGTTKPELSNLFGIDAASLSSYRKDRPRIIWNSVFADDKELEYINEQEEIETSVGLVKTYALPVTTADVMATFGTTGEAAVARHSIGKGAAWLVGLSWRDVVQRSQLNKDTGASRHYSNGFEPSADVWALLIRSIYAKSRGISAWKFTVPAGYVQVLVPTHDCDSRTAYDAMHYMGDYESSKGLRGHYFLTTHYYSDKENFGNSYLSAFYNEETIPKAIGLHSGGHTIGSHSVCHFPDFDKCRNTDVLTREEYSRRATCKDGVSTGASTWAEIVLSKQIIEGDIHNKVRSFRSGHLCVNPDFNSMLEAGNYEFASCYAGGDLLSEFPFFGRIGNEWSGRQSNVLQMPLHISDVYNNKEGYVGINDDNWATHPAVDEWETVMGKLRGNYASAILLIHPNREWKMTLEQMLVDRLDPEDVGLYNFEDYGDFWKARLSGDYSVEYDPELKAVTIVTDLDAVGRYKLAFAIEYDQEHPVGSVSIASPDRTRVVECAVRELNAGRKLAYVRGQGSSVMSPSVCPEPGKSVRGIYNLQGMLIDIPRDALPAGLYIIDGQKVFVHQ